MDTDNRYTGVQALRFIAAMLVVYTHAMWMVSDRILLHTTEEYWRPGMSGVDLFFVISGFVMAISSRNLVGRVEGWKIFLTRRIIRIVPLYWIATTFKLALLLAIPSLVHNTPLDFYYVLASYLFIPTFFSTGFMIEPLMPVGWTLNYEMLFYLLFALALFLRLPVLKFTASVFILFTVINVFSTPEFAYGYGYLNPIMLEFVMGMLIAELCKRGFTIKPWIGIVAVMISFAIMFTSGDYPIWWRWVYWGLPSMVIVGVVTLSEQKLRKHIPQLITTLGDSSYSIYLFHTFVIPALGMIIVKYQFEHPVTALFACMIISPLVGLVIYKLLEWPLVTWLKGQAYVPKSRGDIAPGV